ncbi:MAG: hypothetical protein VXW11_05865, partial [Pseudomonadota bacterium]|nr:hypothetical protein [Pseudomonadota bacterium]
MSTLPEHLKFDSSLTVADLARRFDVTLFTGEGDLVLTHVSTPYAVTVGSFTAVYDDRLAEQLSPSQPFACLTTSAIAKQLASSCPQAAVLVCDNPRRTYAHILSSLFKAKTQPAISGGDTVRIDASSSVHPDATLGPYVVIGPNCVVEAGTVIEA